MINEDFIFDLEYKLSFPNKKPFDKKLWGLWCDGIYPTYESKELSKIINDKRFIELKMSYGQNGQEPYTLIIYFGKPSVSRNARGLDLSVCTPDFAEEPT